MISNHQDSMEVIIIVLIGVGAFIATNLDDFFILMSFFALHTDKSKLIFGQYLGFSILLVIGLLFYQFKFLLPTTYLGVLGFFPIFIGIKYYWNFKNDISTKGLLDKHFDHSKPQKEAEFKGFKIILPMVTTTVANGGDNLAVYIPLFLNMGIFELGITFITFFVMIGLWCGLAYKMVNNQVFGEKLKQYGHVIFPSILIIIGFGMIFRNLQIFF